MSDDGFGETYDMLKDSVDRLLADQVTPALLKGAEQGAMPTRLWDMLEENGFSRALVGEAAGGSGLRWGDVYPLVHAAGRHTLPLPLPEAMLAHWLLDRAGIGVVEGLVTVIDASTPVRAARVDGQWRLDGAARFVPWGRVAPHAVLEVMVDDAPHVALVALHEPVHLDLNLAREPRDDYAFAASPALAVAPLPDGLGGRSLRRYGAMLRAAQMAGAADRLVAQSVQYALERSQFGKPIGKFQAIQQQMAVLGSEAVAMGAIARFAFTAADDARADFAIASAKIRNSGAAGKVASIAHAVHGAIGFTYEHTLHFASRRLWSWRSEFGHAAWWAEHVGRATCASGEDYWSRVTDTRLALPL